MLKKTFNDLSMIKIKFSLILFAAFFLGSCTEVTTEKPTEAYTTLEIVYADFIKVLKTEDDQKLLEFCYRVAPDEKTFVFMRENELCYRKIPCGLDANNVGIETIGNSYLKPLITLRKLLIFDNLLENLSLDPSVQYNSNPEKVKGLNIIVSEMSIVMLSSGKTITLPLGEMILMDGKWSLFTQPGIEYTVSQ